jgi:maleylpyruvate isomerase
MDDDLSRDLTRVADHTQRLLRTCAGLENTAAPSLCEGWSRGHVVTHLARNAEAIGRLADWAVSGEPQLMYPGGTKARDADIEAGASRAPAELLEDLTSTAQALTPKLEALRGTLAVDEVELRGGLQVGAPLLPFLRLREVLFHHVDLDAGFTFADVDDDLLRRYVEDAVGRLRRDLSAPGIELHSSQGDRWVVGEPAVRVTGSLAGILLWLARRIPAGVSADGSLPELPRGA